MTPKEKALELVKMYYPIVNGGEQSDWVLRKAKDCALIAVDEIIIMITSNDVDVWDINILNYWNEVKQEIEKI